MKKDQKMDWELLDAGKFLETPLDWIWNEECDGRLAASENHRVIFENQFIRMLEIKIYPGEKENFHTHPYPSIMMIDSPVNMRYYGADGKMKFERIFPDNQPLKTSIAWREPEGLHSIENIDNRIFHGMRIELLFLELRKESNIHKAL